jgi:hypothetical protein
VVFGGGLDAQMGMVLGFSALALTVLLWFVVRARRRLARMQREVEGLRRMVHAL